MGGAIRRVSALRGLARALDRSQSHPQLRLSGGLGQLLHGLAVAVAAQEVHAPVGARPGRAADTRSTRLTASKYWLQSRAAHEAQARDDVRHRDLGRGLALMLAPDRVLGGHLLGGEVRVDGGADGGKAGAVLAQALEELNDVAGVEVPGSGGGLPWPAASIRAT